MEKYKKIFVIGNGEDFSNKKILEYSKKSDYIIASDGGLNTLDILKIKPDLLIGDFDSVNKKVLNKYLDVKIEKYPPEKDFTDSQLALSKAISLNPEEINLFGMTGTYFDHSFANVINLISNNSGININIITSNSIIFPIIQKKVFFNLRNRRISFFPLSEVTDIKLQGFKYLFTKDNISIMDYSISNVISNDFAEINFNDGKLICILFDEGFL